MKSKILHTKPIFHLGIPGQTMEYKQKIYNSVSDAVYILLYELHSAFPELLIHSIAKYNVK